MALKVLTTTALSVNALRQVIRLHFSRSVSMLRRFRAFKDWSYIAVRSDYYDQTITSAQPENEGTKDRLSCDCRIGLEACHFESRRIVADERGLPKKNIILSANDE